MTGVVTVKWCAPLSISGLDLSKSAHGFVSLFPNMNLLFIGDIFASPGRGIVSRHLHRTIEENSIELVIANAENSAGGFGITPLIAEELFSLGIDVLTSGNHIWDKKEIYDYFSRQSRLLRPANYPDDLPGNGVVVVEARNGVHCAVINLQGRTHMPATNDPFRKADQILSNLNGAVKVKFVDFHAELTSEKMAMGWYLNGRVSAVVGTHTHIPTADTRLLPGRHGIPDGCRDDRTVRFDHRSGERHHPAEVPDSAPGPDGIRAAWGGIACRDCRCGREDREGDCCAAVRDCGIAFSGFHTGS